MAEKDVGLFKDVVFLRFCDATVTEFIFNFFQRMTAIAVEKVGANKVVYTSTGKVLLVRSAQSGYITVSIF